MSEELEKKPKAVVHKKVVDSQNQQENQGAATQPKKKIVIVKKKNPQVPQNSRPNSNVRVVAKKNDETEFEKKSESLDKNVSQSQVSQVNHETSISKTETRPQNQSRTQQGNTQNRVPFSLNSTRPNVKAGNLSDFGRKDRNGFNRDRNGFQGQRQNRENSGFTGTQARQGYQNRERDGNRQFQNRNGQNSNFNNRQGNFQNRNQQGAMGQNRQNGQRFSMSQGGFKGSLAQGSSNVIPPMMQNRMSTKKTFKGKKQVYNRKDEEQYDDNLFETKKKSITPAAVVPKSIEIMETVSVSDLARKMNLKANEVIAKLMAMGMMVTITQSIDSDTATLLASEYGCEVKLISLYDETVIEGDKDIEENMLPRPPIVTVMGHVDHGKTKTLDAIRKSHVAEGEAGGITQSIGAYSVKTDKGSITFLDTPGHEAFTMMRARGAQVTDIVVLVVAADDGVMPQTLEAISHAKDAKVPIIVAVNKCDKPEANPDRVKTQLSEHGLTPEEWGGDTQYVHISALKGEGIDDLLDAILLQAEMLELKATYECRAEGKILESRIDQGRGVVSTVIIQKGSLQQGDPFVAGIFQGHVRAMFDDCGKRIQKAGPSTPVEVLGMAEMPNAGDPFQVTETEREARDISAKRQELKRFEDAKAVKKVTLENFTDTIKNSQIAELKVIIKADLQGSAEALKASLEKLSTKDIRLSVIHSSAGAINESDVTLAAADSNAIIIGFNVRPTPKAKILADQEKVDIRKYNIIYKCVEEIQAAMEGMLRPDTKEQTIGGVEVRNTFKVPKVGLIAGCYVTDGCVKKNAFVNLVRDGIVKFTGKISSLRRFKDDVKEVATGFECGIGLENWQDIQVGDHLEIFEYIEIARKLGDELHDDRAENEKKAKEAQEKAMQIAEEEKALEAEKLSQEKALAKAKKAGKVRDLGTQYPGDAN
ncbi:MAG: translation initiation factor IF-2 [Treponema sp.]|nr:translation initiation factor IF-2 [Treponema sp.]